MWFTQVIGGEYLHESKCTCTPLKHVYSFLLVHRPIGILLVVSMWLFCAVWWIKFLDCILICNVMIVVFQITW